MRQLTVLAIVVAVAAAPMAFASKENGVPLPITHGGDPISLASDAGQLFATANGDVQCMAGTAGTYYIRVIYARAHNDADNYASSVSTIRNLVAGAQQLVNDAAAATGQGTASLKVRCVGGVVSVDEAVLGTSKASANYNTIFADLQSLGYNDPKVKYWVWYDDTGACTCAGIAHQYGDDSPGVSNYNNGNAATMFAVTFGYNSVRTMLHELSHNLGAVQDSALHSTRAGHCYDGRDTLCYNDGGPNGGRYSTSYCSVEVYDCGRDDYFHTNPAAGSYLATHWNIGGPNIRYIAVARNIAPTMTSLSCTPTSAVVGESISCTFSATDSAHSIAYNVNWADGTTQRVPASGYLASGTAASASHAYSWDGAFAVSVTATDDDASPLTSSAITASVAIQGPPVLSLLFCSPNPSESGVSVTCSFRATDNSTGVHYVLDWGDGSATERVPATGTVAPGVTRTASRAYAAAGSYTFAVTATDNGAPALSTSGTTTITVDPNSAPVMTALSCTPNPVQADNPTTCSFSATDASGAVYYEVDWGDGSATQRVPPSGTVSAGVAQTAAHTYTTSATRVVSVTATDTATPALTSPPRTLNVQVTPPNVAPTMQSFTCQPSGALIVTWCTARAADTDSTGVRYNVQWGDGTSSISPTTGHANPGVDQAVGHTYANGGTYLVNVTATDNGSPARTSTLFQTSIFVSADASGPNLAIQEPQLRKVYNGCGITQEIFVGDPVFLTRGCVKATASDMSGVAHIRVYINGVRVAEDTTAPYTLDFAVPHGLIDATLTVTATDSLGNTRSASMRVDTV